MKVLKFWTKLTELYSSVIDFVKNTITEWFGGYDYYRFVYTLYAVGGVWTLKTKYVNSLDSLRTPFIIFRYVVTGGCIMTFLGLVIDAYLFRNNIEKLTFNLSTSVLFIGSSIRILILAYKKDELEECLDMLNNNLYLPDVGKSDIDIQILQSGEKHLKELFRLFIIFMILGIPSRIICQLAPSERMMMIPFPYLSTLPSPEFEFFFFVQTIGFVYFMLIVMFQELVIYGILIRVRKHFEIIAKNIGEITSLYPESLCYAKTKNETDKSGRLLISKKNYSEVIKYRMMGEDICRKNDFNYVNFSKWRKEKTKGMIREAIIHHQTLTALMTKLNNLFKESLFILIFGGGLLLVVIFVDVIWKSKRLALTSVPQAMYAIAMLADITLMCYYGSNVEEYSHEAAIFLYESPWLEMDLENRKAVVLFLLALWKHPKLTAGRLVPLNLNIYIKFVNMIYNCMAFMQNTAKRNVPA